MTEPTTGSPDKRPPPRSIKAAALDVIDAWNDWTADRENDSGWEELLEAIDRMAARLGMTK